MAFAASLTFKVNFDAATLLTLTVAPAGPETFETAGKWQPETLSTTVSPGMAVPVDLVTLGDGATILGVLNEPPR
ncbi:MAG TPA: hypothetical protein VNF08_02340 [Acidimicrobiales bacterium]|nr:hypothetical protein [Acidimicrobiales bacterium]